MWNIFIVIFCLALALPFFNPYFFIGYLVAIAFFAVPRHLHGQCRRRPGITPRRLSR